MDFKVFYDNLRKTLFTKGFSEKQVEGIDNLLRATEGLSVPKRAYIFATTYHETGTTMQPVRETHAITSDSAVARLENAWQKGQLKWVKTPYWRKDADGKSWHGRGYVQLTHKVNYERAAKELGVDFVANPDLAMVPKHAADILVKGMVEGWFTGRSLDHFFNDTRKDYRSARAIINGTDRALDIEGHAIKFEAAFVEAMKNIPEPERVEVDVPPVVPNQDYSSVVDAIIALLRIIFGGSK